MARRARRSLTLLPSADEGDFETLTKAIRPEWVDEALQATGTASIRRRRLPADLVLWLVLGMALYRRTPVTELVKSLDLVVPGTGPVAVARSGVVQARQRLGDAPIRHLFRTCANRWGHDSARKQAWRGLAVYGVDGTTVRVPDSQANREHFGGQRGRDGGDSGYPLVRGVALMALRSHIFVDVAFGPYGKSEREHAEALWHQVPEDALVIVDRGFLDAKILIPITSDETNRYWLTRARSNTSYRVLKSWSATDQLVELKVSGHARALDPSLPKTWQVRAIRYQRRGFRPQLLLTSMLDPKPYPAKEVIALYHERWELELGFDEVKTEVLDRQEALRSQKPAGVMQELWGVALAYNLVRLEMERVADELDVPPTRISFIWALRLMRHEWQWLADTGSPGAIPKHLQAMREDLASCVLPPRHTERQYPRGVKIKMSNYDRKRPRKTVK
jgi:Insertion element 4 transposase N-terminal/Transposase DDE domain